MIEFEEKQPYYENYEQCICIVVYLYNYLIARQFMQKIVNL